MNEIEILKRKLERERAARKQAEQILESKALELYMANESLRKLNDNLEDQIATRTKDLQDSELKYRNVIQNATDIIYSTDEEGYFTFINPRGSDAFGYSNTEIIGKRYLDFVLEEYKSQLFKYYTSVKEEGIKTDYFEFPIRSKDKKIHWIGQNVNRVERADGTYYFNAVARDITLRKNTEEKLKRAQKALTQSEVKYRSVLENLELGLMEVDTKGKIIRVYDRFCKMTGYSKDELLGKDAIKTLLVEEFQEVLRKQDSNRNKKQSGVYEVKIRRKDGKHIWVLISGAPFYNSFGEVIGSLGIHFDITDRKELETNLDIARHKAVEAQKAEQQFLAHMSHEIRTPLNAIIGMSHLLTDTPLDTRQSELVEILSDSASLLKGLVSDILDISKIDSGMIERNDSTFDLVEFANRLEKTFELRASDKGVEFISDIVCDESCIVRSDMQWLNQICINLISNAIKFTSKGVVTFKVNKIKKSNNSCLFYFEVSDTGIGMNSAEIKNVFTAFKQANRKIRNEFGGTGLGLSIATRLVALLGGELEVESKKGNGSRFFFSLNLETVHDFVSKSPLYNLNQAYTENTKILVVEDNLMNQKYISALLEKWNLDYDIAENGKQAIDRYELQHYNLIFMDLSMPIMDGYEATNIIRSMPGEKVPIIALTASTFLSKKELALQAGMTDFLAKPFTPEELSNILRKHLAVSPDNDSRSLSTSGTLYALDKIGLSQLYLNDYSYALDMFQTYKNVITNEIEQLEYCLNGNDREPIRKQVHKIKPMFKMVGLNPIYESCATLESMIKDLNLAQIKTLSLEIIQKARESSNLIDEEIIHLTKMKNSTNDKHHNN